MISTSPVSSLQSTSSIHCITLPMSGLKTNICRLTTRKYFSNPDIIRMIIPLLQTTNLSLCEIYCHFLLLLLKYYLSKFWMTFSSNCLEARLTSIKANILLIKLKLLWWSKVISNAPIWIPWHYKIRNRFLEGGRCIKTVLRTIGSTVVEYKHLQILLLSACTSSSTYCSHFNCINKRRSHTDGCASQAFTYRIFPTTVFSKIILRLLTQT